MITFATDVMLMMVLLLVMIYAAMLLLNDDDDDDEEEEEEKEGDDESLNAKCSSQSNTYNTLSLYRLVVFFCPMLIL